MTKKGKRNDEPYNDEDHGLAGTRGGRALVYRNLGGELQRLHLNTGKALSRDDASVSARLVEYRTATSCTGIVVRQHQRERSLDLAGLQKPEPLFFRVQETPRLPAEFALGKGGKPKAESHDDSWLKTPI